MSGSKSSTIPPSFNSGNADNSVAAFPQAGGPPNIESTTLIELTTEQETQLIKYAMLSQSSLTNQYSLRWNLEQIDRHYMRETDWTPDNIKSRIANETGDSSKFQNVQVPIIMPQVQASHGYLCNVFLTGYPIFGVTADPMNENSALQMETIIGENAVTSGWSNEISMAFRDGLKYNLCAIECDWKQRTNWTIKTDVTNKTGSSASKVLWQGNVLKRLDLYNSFWDPRVHPSEMHESGEFVGYTEIFSRSKFKKYVNELYNKVPVKNAVRALASKAIQGDVGTNSTAPFGYYQPLINPYPFFNRQSGVDWMSWVTNTVQQSNGANFSGIFSVTRFYARIIPNDFNIKVPEKNTPQVWKFIIVNGQVILSAERLTNVHNFIPIFFAQPINDGLDYQTKSFASNVKDLQYTASAMWNGYMASKRRLVGDRVLYDPSRIREKDINSTNPAAKIPVRPSAYGRQISDAVYQFPYRDEMTDSFVSGTAAIVNFANMINGQNPAQQGQFVKGNKTKHEYDDVMGHGNSNNQTMAMSFENSMFTPMKEVIKLNILQYQPQAVVYNAVKGKNVNIEPTDLRKEAVHFKVSDGLIPADKITGEDMIQSFMQVVGTSPQIAAGFNLAPLVVYTMKTQGLDLTPFAKSPAQLQYEQELSAWQQAQEIAVKAKQEFNTPMPQPSPQYQQEMATAQQNGGYQPSVTSSTLEDTQGK